MKVLTWKDEGDAGPAHLYEDLETLKTAELGVPYGTPLPGTDLGWCTRAAAVRKAKLHGAEFREV